MWTVIGGPYNSVFTGRRARRPIAAVTAPIADTPSGGFMFAPTGSRKEAIRKKRIKLGILPPDKVVEPVVQAQPVVLEPQVDEASIIEAQQQHLEDHYRAAYVTHMEEVRKAQVERKKRLMRFILLNS